MPLSFFSRLLGLGPDPKDDLRPLWHRIVEIAREPEWYAQCKVADSVDGRFDMIVAVLSIVMLRMEREPELVPPTGLLTELFVDDMDGQLREFGVGDVVVGKNMGKLMSMLGGRLGVYRDGLSTSDTSLAQAVARNVTFAPDGSPDCVADRLREFSGQLAGLDGDRLLAGDIER